MENTRIFGHFVGLTAVTVLILSLNGCGTGNAAIKAAEEKERAELASTGGKVSSAVGLRLGFAGCNLRYSGDWVSDQSSGELPFILLGTPMLVRGLETNRAEVEVDGKSYRLGHDYGRAQEKTAEWVDKLVQLDDPALKLARFPANIRAAIESGKILRGMTKEQVIMALGYPATHETPNSMLPNGNIIGIVTVSTCIGRAARSANSKDVRKFSPRCWQPALPVPRRKRQPKD